MTKGLFQRINDQHGILHTFGPRTADDTPISDGFLLSGHRSTLAAGAVDTGQ